MKFLLKTEQMEYDSKEWELIFWDDISEKIERIDVSEKEDLK